MKAQVTYYSKQSSRVSGGWAHMITFKGEDGKSYRTWIDSANGNFSRWKSLIEKLQTGAKPSLGNLIVKKPGLVDADSQFEILS